METDLEILAGTIAAHARELAGQEWEREHRPILMQIIKNSGLADERPNGLVPVGTLSLGDREVPIEAIIKALHEHFLERRTRELLRKLTDQVVRAAAKKVEEEEAGEE
jgi:hypothetical protein